MTQPSMIKGFEILKSAPTEFWWAVLIVFSGSFGMSTLRNIKKKYNVSKYEPMNNSTKELLKTFFKEHNKRLEDYLQMDFNWND